ncbi:methylenetetrahydrofolate reductase [Arthrobacter mangrovi]|uniref:Methylenetetrahydrofolate reductase n=1 Tax=Arthrobacter mangrovi TaxID=2966350 RepID=A0ABQ5MZ02_9MICC|nr:methylenetetrahydrofolate reductase [Arthrobacter mangrovi]GLB69173.1 5,10-methylenetetrahydrofolate reductase [Arthrobacter mangrovi]
MTRVNTIDDAVVQKTWARLLDSPRWEMAPVKNPLLLVDDLPSGATVTMGCFANSEGFQKSIELTAAIIARGFEVIPHLPTRSLTGRDHLKDVLDAYRDAGVADIFVVAGNTKKPAGPYDGALEALEDIAAAGFRIGVGAYPEGHLYMDEAAAFELLRRKQEYASYLVTQTCFDAEAFRSWLTRLREAEVSLPAHLGIAGVVQRKELIRMAGALGFGASMKFISKQRSLATKMMLPGAYDPTGLLTDVARVAADASLGVSDVHLNTFNQVASTRAWWDGLRGKTSS